MTEGDPSIARDPFTDTIRPACGHIVASSNQFCTLDWWGGAVPGINSINAAHAEVLFPVVGLRPHRRGQVPYGPLWSRVNQVTIQVLVII
jgi:hypothetical protein